MLYCIFSPPFWCFISYELNCICVCFLGTAAQEGHEGVARLLLASGADPNRADGCGRTALKVRKNYQTEKEKMQFIEHGG